ncbi:isoquinoline 1-oxidoreductase beta subunit [Herbihabitans rhizosphaerae]|uniref:Isoquinoline 1-oxidoreductase beta subunit n=1 Tax=Herbihabitans rhizosphaerae TaxID=1872711 RepID=A0A4Q7L1Z5_9PSEU|nr:molybdopterin cofactor-binding domain-containing protein [Herbihabitans rhizosphaerae]RZS43568.1 isoquinoline 1-oxidoreductase beta subunit [Herbihabitans rhizosphaerae]
MARSTKESTGIERRRFLTFLVAAPVLTVAADLSTAKTAAAVVPSPPAVAEIADIGDLGILVGLPTAHMIVIEVTDTVRLRLPRTEVGQGITTAVAMLVAEELDLPIGAVAVTLEDARPELLFNQLTGSSNSVRSLYDPIRHVAAAARGRLLAAASTLWDLPTRKLHTRDGAVVAPDGRRATYGTLTAAAADRTLRTGAAQPKPESEHTLVGTPTTRVDARAIVTGQVRYALDLDVPGALPTMVRRPPTINGSVRSVDNRAAVLAMPGVVAVSVIPTGVGVTAETFGQALDGKNALEVTWNRGTVDDLSDSDISAKLRNAAPRFPAPNPLVQTVDADFEFAFVSHAPLETNSAIADVRADRAEIWSGLKAPIIARQTIAAALGLPVDRVTVHVTQAGGSFGRRLFFDGALEAAQISRAIGRPVKLMWSRIDDMRHGRARPASHHKIRATMALGQVLSFEHRVASVETDFRHGIGEILSAAVTHLPIIGNLAFSQALFLTTIHTPYHFGATKHQLSEVPLKMHTASFRSVYSANTRGAEEIMVDLIAEKMGKDPVAFRHEFLKNDRQRAVLDAVASAGNWGRPMPDGHAQGIGIHDEYKSCTACLVEIDARDRAEPRVTKAVIAVDVGKPVNPRGLEAQMLGGLTDAISTTLRAGLHIDKGLPLEGSYSQFHYARQKNTPTDVKIVVMPAHGKPGGAGELGLPAAVGAIANAYRRATGTTPTLFPIHFPVDFEPFPR